jgi:hypothetical protein
VRVARLEEEKQRIDELHILMKEELAWFKAQVYGRSGEKSSSEVSPDQAMLFNEPEVLAAIATAIGERTPRLSRSRSTSARRSLAERQSRPSSRASSLRHWLSRKPSGSARTVAQHSK